MRWSERQLAMLREMGIRVWAPPARVEEAGGTVVAERPLPPATAPVAPAAAPVAPMATPVAPAARPAGSPTLESADWLVVAEPFAAGAADPAVAADAELLLDNILRAIRVSRRAPAREGRAVLLPVEEGGAAAIEAAIATVQPRCILAFGRIAAAALLGADAPLGKLREQLHERDGIPVAVTFALPYLLRHAEDKPRAWSDLCRAVSAIT